MNHHFAIWLKKQKDDLKMSPEDMAVLFEMSPSAVYKWLSGESSPKLPTQIGVKALLLAQKPLKQSQLIKPDGRVKGFFKSAHPQPATVHSSLDSEFNDYPPVQEDLEDPGQLPEDDMP